MFRNREVYSRFYVHKNAKQITIMNIQNLNATRSCNSEQALTVLNDFYKQVYREIKRTQTVTVSAICNDEISVKFSTDKLELSLTLTEN